MSEPERYGSVTIRGGEIHIDAELEVVEIKKGRVSIRFNGEMVDLRVSDTLLLHLTGTMHDMQAGKR